MKLSIEVLAILTVAALPTPAWCSQTSAGTVNYYAPSGATLAFSTTGARTTPPACATDPLWTITLGGNSDAIVASILSMYLAGRSFEVYGSGTCDGPRETIAFIVAR